MEKHLLITIGEDSSALHAVRFSGEFFQDKSDIKITLLYVSHHRGVSENVDFPGSEHDRGQIALDTSRRMLIDRGFPPAHIYLKRMGHRLNTAKDIIFEARKGMYDAVLLGRRGYAVFSGTLTTSISQEVLDHKIDFPLWICKNDPDKRSNVLLCIDESEPCMRMADHVGFMLGGKSGHKITILHVETGNGARTPDIMERTAGMLTINGFPPADLSERVIRSTDVVNTILHEANYGRYAAVAVGRCDKHPEKSIFTKWMSGSSNSQGLLEKLDRAALWISK